MATSQDGPGAESRSGLHSGRRIAPAQSRVRYTANHILRNTIVFLPFVRYQQLLVFGALQSLTLLTVTRTGHIWKAETGSLKGAMCNFYDRKRYKF